MDTSTIDLFPVLRRPCGDHVVFFFTEIEIEDENESDSDEEQNDSDGEWKFEAIAQGELLGDIYIYIS